MSGVRDRTANGPVLITGASGFVGRRLVARLRSRLSSGRGLHLLRGPDGSGDGDPIDLTDARAVANMVAEVRPSAVVHLAAFSSVGAGASAPDWVWQANFDATRALAQAARALSQPVRFIFASTAEVYGAGFNDGPRDETSPVAPASAYARSKAACEFVLRDLAGEELDVVALRLFNHTGPGQDDRFVVPALARQIAAIAPGASGEVRVGNLEARRDFTDVEDMIDAYCAVLDAPSVPVGFSQFNVGSGRERSIQSILDHLIGLHGGPVTVVRDPARLRPSDIPVAGGVFTRFAETFGWSPRRPFEDTMAAILDDERRRLFPA